MEIIDLIKNSQFNIVDSMIDWVRVVDKDNNVFYANKKMREDLGDNLLGAKCYESLCQDHKCEYCISHETLTKGLILKKEAIFNNRTYMVVSSPLYAENDGIVGSVEVFRDITHEKELARSVNEKNKKMSQDIDFARNMQIRALPIKGMYNGIKIDYLYESSEQLSGDFFDVYQIDKNNVGIYICDVVGHGVTAALLTIFVRQSLRSINLENKDSAKIIEQLHKTFLGLNLDYDKYISIFFGIYNKSTHEFQYVNAGHNSVPILLKSHSNEMEKLIAKGYPICNIFENVSYDVNKIKLHEGDKLFFYTDGITESKNEHGEEFGENRLINIIKNSNNKLVELKLSLEQYRHIQKDDYAMLMAEII
ncbi:MAG: SpoIIE family protein phosphatase [Tissierellia bacterium]|nr:SpoIIE family protein phosphatase [Tissierellia bacterium]MDD4780122.1 SpoIIE family protein phosphatase [Tissierellia bacterium]